jgi:hypothetical protein
MGQVLKMPLNVGVLSFGVRHAARGMVELGRQVLAHEWRIST